MATGSHLSRIALAAALAVLLACRSDPEPPPPADDNVFADNYGPGVSYQAFAGVPSSATVSVDTEVKRTGTASLRLEVPATAYAGGAFVTEAPRNLSGFNALTLWVRGSQAATLNELGLGNDNTGAVPFVVTRRDVPVTTDWTRVVVPIPLPARLVSERGMLYFAEGSDEGAYTLWFDDVKYEALPAEELALASAAIRTESALRGVGESVQLGGTRAAFTAAGEEVAVEAAPRYFTFTSSAPEVATVAEDGRVTAVGLGSATITAKLGARDAEGALTLIVESGNAPSAAAPGPDEPAADVISLFSDAYTSRAVDTWSAEWDQADVSDVDLAGDAAKKYSNLVFAGVEFTSQVVDAREMTHFHLDVWTPDATTFKVKLVDFGADGLYGGGDDTEHELAFDAASTPALAQRAWVSLDVPLSAFSGLAARSHLAQLIFVGAAPPALTTTVYLDNIYFYRGEAPPPGPTFPVLFADAWAAGVGFSAFDGSMGTPAIDSTEKHAGESSVRIEVPATAYFGGAFVGATARDLSPYDALTFWARANKAASLNVAGLGVDNAGGVAFKAERNAIPLTTAWTKVVVPIPLPSKVTAERALFHLAEGSDEGAYTIWIDDVRYEALGASVLGTPAPAIATEAVTREIGAQFPVNGPSVAFPLGGQNAVVAAAGRYFTWTSSAPAVASVDEAGVVTANAVGSAQITAELGAIAAAGMTTVTVVPPSVPASAAPTPTSPAADVLALFSDAYTPVTSATWSTVWDQADVADVSIAGNPTKKYTNLVFAGIEPAATIDATAMTHFHLDVWTPDAVTFKVKLVDFGADGVYGGTDNSEHELVFDAASTPALAQGVWVSLDLPFSAFTSLTARAHLAQLILVGVPSGGSGTTTAYVDNVYFHK